MFSSQFEYADNDSGDYTGQIDWNKLLCVVKVSLPQLDFMEIAMVGERVCPI